MNILLSLGFKMVLYRKQCIMVHYKKYIRIFFSLLCAVLFLLQGNFYRFIYIIYVNVIAFLQEMTQKNNGYILLFTLKFMLMKE